ncbi:hypothetical protein JZX76_15600 [Haloarcula hispanica]|uniref:Uncharacterized protein n=1 Tax=Haloarcula hispanica TaxID=51589 RepID=A0A482T3V6_HALHI|nr:hypothetical protein [Haloarcula hispanica]MCJ0620881.1 hypothetical protein [Haloarcula hispanica]RYJ11238.1 hypothetical protein ELS20_15450 [Haloarcula hispanica]
MSLTTTVGTILVGALAPLVIQWFLPRNIKLRIKYIINRASNAVFRRGYVIDSKISRGYEVEDPAELGELTEDLRVSLGTSPQSSLDRFDFSRKNGGKKYQVDVQLQWESEMSGPGGLGESMGMGMPETESEQKVVSHIRIAVSGELPYGELEEMLFNSYEVLRNVESDIPAEMDGNAYSFVCETGQPPLINRVMDDLGFENIKATTTEGLELEIRNDTIRLRNLDESAVGQAITKTKKMVTLYG